MFETPIVQVTYNARLHRARLQFAAGECRKSRKPPASIFKKIEERFRTEKEEGSIEVYEVFAKRFTELWQYVRRHLGKSISPKQQIKFTIGQGGRYYEEIKISHDSSNKDSGPILSCNFSEKRLANIGFNSFLFNVLERLSEYKIAFKADRGQLRFIYLLLQHGQVLREMPLIAQPKIEEGSHKKFLVRFNAKYRYATLHLFASDCFLTDKNRKNLWSQAVAEVQKLNTQGLNLTFLNQHSLEKLASLSYKVQALGFNLPYDLLIAYDENYHLDFNRLQSEILAQSVSENVDHADSTGHAELVNAGYETSFFKVSVVSDGMLAVISQVNQQLLERQRSEIDAQWLISDLQKKGISFGYYTFIEELQNNIERGRALDGLTVAEGQPANPGRTTYIYMHRRDLRLQKDGKVNIREMQNPNMFLAGELIAEVRFVDGVPGCDVRGQQVHALGSAREGNFSAGNGVELRDDCYFYATRNGIAELDGQVIKCSDVHTIKGSVNLSSGNLYFDGAVVIKGDIESGAVVDVQGSLMVEGMIGPSQVRCSGDLNVKGGIVTTAKGWVKAGGSIRCEFIENSMIESRDNVTVNRSIMHSQVIAAGNIQVVDPQQGVIAGGSVSAWGSIRTARCGMPQTSSSECRIGGDFPTERRLSHLKLRLEKIAKYHENLQRQLKGKNQDGHAQISKRAKRCAEILAKLSERRDLVESQMGWNADSVLMVTGTLDRSVRLMVAGRMVPIEKNMTGTVVLATRYQGSTFASFDSLPAIRQSHPEINLLEPQSDKKK